MNKIKQSDLQFAHRVAIGFPVTMLVVLLVARALQAPVWFVLLAFWFALGSAAVLIRARWDLMYIHQTPRTKALASFVGTTAGGGVSFFWAISRYF